jgi:hypothetical protein
MDHDRCTLARQAQLLLLLTGRLFESIVEGPLLGFPAAAREVGILLIILFVGGCTHLIEFGNIVERCERFSEIVDVIVIDLRCLSPAATTSTPPAVRATRCFPLAVSRRFVGFDFTS